MSQSVTLQRSDELIWRALRIVVATLISLHGWARWAHDAIAPFARWLTEQGIPLAQMVANAVTLFEIGAAIPLAFARTGSRLVAAIAVVFAAIYVVGIAMVHAKAGWFVVGLGRNGAEYSVLLIALLAAIAAREILLARTKYAVS